MKKLLLLCFILMGCQQTSVVDKHSELFTFSQFEQEEQLTALQNTLLSHNFLVSKLDDNALAVKMAGAEVALQPLITSDKSPDGIDRIVLTQYFAVHPSLVGRPQIIKLVLDLNRNLNFAKFVFKQQGKVIVMQNSLTFIDALHIDELRRFIIWTEKGLTEVAKILPEGTTEIIKPVPLLNK